MTTIYSGIYPDPDEATRTIKQSSDIAGRVRSWGARVVVPASSEVGDILMLMRIPSSLRILPTSLLDREGLGTDVTMSVGFTGAAAALVSAVAVATAGQSSLVAAVSRANYHLRAWQHAGLSKDPGGYLDIFATLAGATTTSSAKVVNAELHGTLD